MVAVNSAQKKANHNGNRFSSYAVNIYFDWRTTKVLKLSFLRLSNLIKES